MDIYDLCLSAEYITSTSVMVFMPASVILMAIIIHIYSWIQPSFWLKNVHLNGVNVSMQYACLIAASAGDDEGRSLARSQPI